MSMLFSSQEIRKAYQLFIGQQAISLALSLGSAILIARQVGPQVYGAYFISITVLEYLLQACQFGMVPYLYRDSPKHFPRSLDSYFTFSFTASIVVALLAFSGLLLYPFEDSETVWSVKAVIFSLPLFVANQTLRLSLEKELKSKEIVSSEILAQATFLVVGGSLAFLQKGIWAPVVGWWAHNSILFLLLFLQTERKPRFDPNWSTQRTMLKSGVPILSVSLVSGMEGLALSGLTALKLGVTSTGELGLVRKIISRASFLRVPNTRLSNIVCGNHVADQERLKSFVEKNLFGNTLAFGVLFLVLAWTPNFVYSSILGPDWGSGYRLLPFLSFTAFTMNSFYVLQATLASLEANKERLLLACLNMMTLVTLATVLIPHLGMMGWAVAESVAALVWLGLFIFVQRKVGPFRLGKALGLWLAFGFFILARGVR